MNTTPKPTHRFTLRDKLRPYQTNLNPNTSNNTTNKPSNIPDKFAEAEPTRSPRVNQLQEVVMPHAGHRRPNNIRIEHGGKPNC